MLRGHRRMIVQSIGVNLFMILISLIPPYLTKILIDNVYPNQDEHLLYIILILTVLISIFSGFISFINGYFVHNLNMRLALKTGLEFYRHIGTLNFSFFDQRKVGEIISRESDALSSISGVLVIINTAFQSLFTLIIFPPVLIYINWKLALLSIAVLPIDAIMSWYMSKFSANRTRILAEKSAEVSAKRIEYISGIRTIQALGIENFIFGRIKNLTVETAGIRLNTYAWQGTASFFLSSAHALGAFIYSIYGWIQILSGHLTLGSYLAFTAYVGYLSAPMQGMMSLLINYREVLVHIQRFTDIYDLRPDIYNDPKLEPLIITKGSIVFNQVSFAYKDELVLKNISLAFQAGCITAVVGKSGNGKTTLVQLIPRLYDPQAGTITIDNQKIEQVSLSSLRKQIGFVQQDPFLFYGTIKENIAIGYTQYAMWRIEEAAKIADAHEFIQALPEGYDTQVGERGVQLSQGQKQRVVLARAVLLNTPILILDEATSALDTESERKIYNALGKERTDYTTIIISHRLSTIKNAHQIVVIDENTIVEQGTHAELMKLNKVYYSLYGMEEEMEKETES